MKILLLVAAVLFSAPAFAQMPVAGAEAVAPFKQANAILIHTKDSSTTAVKTVARLLLQRGYIVDKMDLELGMVTTKPKVLQGGGSPEVTLSAVASPGLLTVSSQYTIHAGTMTVSNAGVYSGIENSSNKVVFREGEAIAKAYPGAKIGYIKR